MSTVGNLNIKAATNWLSSADISGSDNIIASPTIYPVRKTVTHYKTGASTYSGHCIYLSLTLQFTMETPEEMEGIRGIKDFQNSI